MELYKNGEADGLFNVYPDIIMLNSEGIYTKVVYIADYSDTGDVIVGRAELSSLLNLKDTKISFEGINSFSHLFVLEALNRAGLKEYDVKFENIPAMNVLAALEEGKIDAGHTWEPVTTQALNKGFKILAKAGDFPHIIIDVLAFSDRVINERSDDIQRIVKSLLEARDFIYSNKETALKIMSEAERISIKELERGINGVYHPDLKENINAMKKSTPKEGLYHSGNIIMNFYIKRGQLSKKLDLDAIIEHRFVKQIEMESR